MELQQLFLRENDCYKAGRRIVPKGVMLHSTGANNPWLKRYVNPDDGRLGKNQYGNHWNRGGVGACVHGFIGKLADGTVAAYQTLPWDMRGWHCGRSGNDTHISIELCEDDLTDSTYFARAYALAVDLTAALCREFSLDPMAAGVVIDHREGHSLGIASDHGDVQPWFSRHGKTMDDFRAAVAETLLRPGEDKEGARDMTEDAVRKLLRQEMPVYATLEDVPQWARPTIAEMVDSGAIQGDGKGLNLSGDLVRTLVILSRLLKKQQEA